MQLVHDAWSKTTTGCLSASAQAKVWALREVWRDTHAGDHGLGAYVASKVEKAGGGHPSGEAIMMLYHKIDADPTWFPCKADEGARGRPRRLLTRGNAAVVARTAMRMKAERKEPTHSRIVAACPKAAMNPAT